MRPKSVVCFERLYVGSAVLGAGALLSGWRRAAASDPQTMLLTFTTLAIVPAILALLVSRRRSLVALVVLASWTWLLGVSFLVGAYLGDFVTVEDWIVFATQMLAYASSFLLFSASARTWRRRFPRQSTALERTFE